MFSGHVGVAFAGKRPAPNASLATLLLAAQWLDVLWPLFLLLGIEHVRLRPGITRMSPFDFYDYPISHSAVTALGWGALYGAVHYARRRSAATALLLAGLVFSHWVLDWATHRPDLPLWPGGPLVGLGLWNAPAAEAIIEGALYAAGVAVYLRATRPRDRVGRYAAWALIAFVPLVHLATAVSPPPPSVKVLAWSAAVAPWPLVLWAWWADRHRQPALR